MTKALFRRAPLAALFVLALPALTALQASAKPVAAKPAAGKPAEAKARFTDRMPMRVQGMEGLPAYDCAPTGSNGTGKGCPEFTVQIFPVNDTGGVARGCLAAMPYSRLTMRLGDGVKSGSIVWKIPAGVPGVFTTDGAYTGIAVFEDPTYKQPPAALFDPVYAVLSDQDKTATLTTRNKALQDVKVDHLPVVLYTLSSGAKVKCLGVDPIITNSEN